jgi:hypothetical protein
MIRTFDGQTIQTFANSGGTCEPCTLETLRELGVMNVKLWSEEIRVYQAIQVQSLDGIKISWAGILLRNPYEYRN